MLKVKVKWTGFSGAPGWSNFYWDNFDGGFLVQASANSVANRVETFLNAIKVRIPNHVSMAIQSDVEDVNPIDGKMTQIYSIASKPAILGTAVTQSYSAASGIVINWRTAAVKNGRRVGGRTFLVPVAGGAYQSDGTITPGDLTETQNAASALLTHVDPERLAVWSRPVTKDKAGNLLPTPIAGTAHQVTVATVPDLAAVLRSRR